MHVHSSCGSLGQQAVRDIGFAWLCQGFNSKWLCRNDPLLLQTLPALQRHQYLSRRTERSRFFTFDFSNCCSQSQVWSDGFCTPVGYSWLKSLGWSLELKSSNLFRDFSQGKFDVWPMDFIQSTASNNEKMLDARPRDFISMIYLCLFVRPWILSLASLA